MIPTTPTQATDHWEKGQGDPQEVAKEPRRLFRIGGHHQVILDSGASHNVIPKECVKNMQWGPVQGLAGFRTADGTWIPNLRTAEIALRSDEGLSFKVCFCVASAQRALLSAIQVLKLGHTAILKGSKAVIHVKGDDAKKALVFKINGSPKATFFFKDFPRRCVEEGR